MEQRTKADRIGESIQAQAEGADPGEYGGGGRVAPDGGAGFTLLGMGKGGLYTNNLGNCPEQARAHSCLHGPVF